MIAAADVRKPGRLAAAQRFFTYSLFIASTFTIAGAEASIFLLMALGLVDWRMNGGAAWRGIPWWVWGPFVALLGVAVLSAAVNPAFLNSLDHARTSYRIFLPFALVAALAVFPPVAGERRLLTVYLVFVALFALYGAIQYRFGVDWLRPEGQKLTTPYEGGGAFHAKGNFTHHLTFAGFMLLNVPVFLALALVDSGGRRALWAAGGVLAALGTLLSLGRSGWLGMAAGVLVLAMLRLPRRWAWPLFAGALAVAALAGALLYTGWLQERVLTAGTPPIVQRLVRTGLAHDVDRLRLWQSGWLAFQDKPVLGHGWGNSDPALEPYRQRIAEANGGYRFIVKASAGLHNIYLQMAFAIGAVGLAVYLAMWGALFAWCVRGISRAPEAWLWERGLLQGIAAALAGSMVAGWFENNFLDGEVQTLIMMWMGLALHVGLRIARRDQHAQRGPATA